MPDDLNLKLQIFTLLGHLKNLMPHKFLTCTRLMARFWHKFSQGDVHILVIRYKE